MAQKLRMPQLNLVVLAGRLVQDPELRKVGDTSLATIRIACDRRFKARNGWETETLFVNVSVWGAAAERAAGRLKKGTPILLEGFLRSRSWETEEGHRRSTIEVVARKIQTLASMEGTEEAAGDEPEDVVEEESEEDLPY